MSERIWEHVFAAACATKSSPHEAETKANEAVSHLKNIETRRAKAREEEEQKRQERIEFFREAGMLPGREAVYEQRLAAWEATLGTFISGPGTGHGKRFGEAWMALSDEEKRAVDEGKGWPGGTYLERTLRSIGERVDLPEETVRLLYGGGSFSNAEAFMERWNGLSEDQRVMSAHTERWYPIPDPAPPLPEIGVQPGIYIAWRALDVDCGPGGVLAARPVGLFARARDALRAARGLLHPGPGDGDIRCTKILTVDGRSGWEIPHNKWGDFLLPLPIWRDVDSFSHAQAMGRLTEDERRALGLKDLAEPAGPPQGFSGPGVLSAFVAAGSIFTRQVDANAVAYASVAGLGPMPSAVAVDVLTLDGCFGWLIQAPQSPEPLTIYHDVEVHLRERALAKLGPNERRACGIEEGPAS